jgi:hypothetical protein
MKINHVSRPNARARKRIIGPHAVERQEGMDKASTPDVAVLHRCKGSGSSPHWSSWNSARAAASLSRELHLA